MGDYVIQQGSVTAGANYTLTYEEGTLSIDPASLTISAVDKSKTYGVADPALTYTQSGLVGSDPINGALTRVAGEDVGAYAIEQGTLDAGANYSITFNTGTLSIDPAALTISAEDKSKTYGLGDPALTYTQSGLVGSDPINGALTRVAGEDVGAYAIEQGTLSAGANYTIAYNPGTLTIDPASLTVTVSASSREYDGFRDATVSFADNRLTGDLLSYSYTIALFVDENVGNGKDVNVLGISVYGTDAGNYSLTNTSASTTADITPKEVNISLEEPFLYIREGDELPEFAIDYHFGLLPGDVANETYTVLRDSDGAMYDPSSSVSAGSYTVTPAAYNSNYNFTVEAGMLHVNPYGPGTRAVKPVLNCIERIRNNYYVANFEYRNDNDVAVYIPWGEDNMLVGSGIDTSIPSTPVSYTHLTLPTITE